MTFTGTLYGTHQEINMLSKKDIECLSACNECAAACLSCAVACTKEADPKALSHCIALDLECADICQLAAASIARGDSHLKAILTLCAESCKSCGDACAKCAFEHCKTCAEACKVCADACDAMAL